MAKTTKQTNKNRNSETFGVCAETVYRRFWTDVTGFALHRCPLIPRRDSHRNKTEKLSSIPRQLDHTTSLSLTLSKASAFSWTAHCPWRTSSVKPPYPSCYYQLRRISSVRKYLSTEATLSETGHLTHSVTPRLLQLSPFWPACFLCLQPSSQAEQC